MCDGDPGEEQHGDRQMLSSELQPPSGAEPCWQPLTSFESARHYLTPHGAQPHRASFIPLSLWASPPHVDCSPFHGQPCHGEFLESWWIRFRNTPAVPSGGVRFDHHAQPTVVKSEITNPATRVPVIKTVRRVDPGVFYLASSSMASRALSGLRTTSAAVRAVRVYGQAPQLQPAARTPADLVQAPEISRAGIWASVARRPTTVRPRRLLGHAAPRRFMAAYRGASPLSAHPCSTHQLLGFPSMNQSRLRRSNLSLASGRLAFTAFNFVVPPVSSTIHRAFVPTISAWHVRTNPSKMRLNSRAAQGRSRR
jgi:hypothetical protein